MKLTILRFKTVEEAERFKWERIIQKGLPYWEFDRYEYARLHVSFDPGVNRFKTIKEKREWEFHEVCKKWKSQS